MEKACEGLQNGRNNRADQQRSRHGQDHEEILHRHLPPWEAACPPGVVDREHKGVEETQGGPDQDCDRDNADAAASLLKTIHHAPEQHLLILAEWHKAMDRRHNRVPGKEVGADCQQESHERHQREKRVIGEGRSVFPAGNAGVDCHGLPEEAPKVMHLRFEGSHARELKG